MPQKLLQEKTIFCVEDNVSNRVVFQLSFAIQGAVVYFERWGRDAIDRLNEMRQVDLIVLDLMLASNVSGFDIFDQIRALPQYGHIPIVAVSAMDPSVAIPKAQEKGFSGFIAKPVSKDLFPQQIAAILNGETVWHAGVRQD